MSCESQSQQSFQDKDNTGSEKTQNHEEILQEIESSQSRGIFDLQMIIQSGCDEQFQKIVPIIATKIKTDKTDQLMKNKTLHYRLLKLFYKEFRQLQSTSQKQEYILFLLSILAEIVRKRNEIRLPFSKKTVLALLTLDYDSINALEDRNTIFLIYLVLLENMAKQKKLMVRLGVLEQLRCGLLILFSKTDEYFVLRILLKTLLELQSVAKTEIGLADLECLTQKVRELFGDKAAAKIKLIFSRPTIQNMQNLEQMTLHELVSGRQ